jgi:Rib/alpha/Esp surface antigen-like repeat protein
VNRFAWKLVCVLALALFASGCGGCQPGEVPEADDAAQRRPAVVTTAQERPPAALPTARDLPTVGVDPSAEDDAADEAQGEAMDEEEPEEADCSVIADADPDFGEPPMTVQFSVDYECTEGGATVKWDFGDGTSAAGEENPSHVYTDTGEYIAVVTVTTPDGAIATDEIDITVEAEDEEPPDVEPGNP